MKKRMTLMRSMRRVRGVWNYHVKKVAAEVGIPDSYRQILMFLFHHPGCSQRQVAEFSGITTSAVNQTVKRMQDEAYLRKETDPSDKRNCKLYLTEKGMEVAEKIYERLDGSDQAITKWLGADREKEWIEILEQLADYIEEEL